MEAVSEDRPLTAQKNMELMIRVSDPLALSTDIRKTFKEILNWVFELLVRIDMAATILLDPEKRKNQKSDLSDERGRGRSALQYRGLGARDADQGSLYDFRCGYARGGGHTRYT